VFDPGINALSILTEVLPERVRVIDARLEFPANRQAPIAAAVEMETASGIPIHMDLDWRQTGPQTWQIVFEAEDDRHVFAQGGDDASMAEGNTDSSVAEEYRAMYKRFVNLARTGRIDVDLAPLQLVADAFLRGDREATEPFEE